MFLHHEKSVYWLQCHWNLFLELKIIIGWGDGLTPDGCHYLNQRSSSFMMYGINRPQWVMPEWYMIDIDFHSTIIQRHLPILEHARDVLLVQISSCQVTTWVTQAEDIGQSQKIDNQLMITMWEVNLNKWVIQYWIDGGLSCLESHKCLFL